MQPPQIIQGQNAFLQGKQYIVPSYQRNYVWTRKDHWEPLWWDIQGLAEQIQDPERKVTPHFLGTIITKRIGHKGLMEQWWVVDGQQRLTTLQILLAASRTAFAAEGLNQFANRLSDLLANDSTVMNESGDKYKMEHKSRDYASFCGVIDRALESGDNDAGDSDLETCYAYYLDTVLGWLNAPGEEAKEDRAKWLTQAMLLHLQLVDIQLDDRENSHAIFEALNARGARLTEWDKTKNYLLSLAVRVRPYDPDGDVTYTEYLKPFDAEPYWNHEVRIARLKGKRIEQFLFYFAQLELPGRKGNAAKTKPISKDHLYREFRDAGEDIHHGRGWKDLQPFLERFQRYASIYRRIQDKRSFSAAAQEVLRHRQVMKIGSLFPLIMELVAKLGDGLEFDDAMAILDSYLMRRLARKIRYSGFDDIAFYYMRVLRATAPADIHKAMLNLFDEGTTDVRWPSDEEILISVPSTTLFGRIAKIRLQILLGAVAERMHRDSYGDTYALTGAAKVGQVAPPDWERHWHKDMRFGYSEEDRIRLDRMTSRMGNLTLLGNPNDKSLSDQSWPQRAEQLEQDDLEMNRRIVADMEEPTWGEDSITRRGRQIAEIMTRLWPHADVFRERLGIER